MDLLPLNDGRVVELGERTKGGTKNETRYGTVGTDAVVVKIQRAHGRLRVPRVVGSGTTSAGNPLPRHHP